MVENTAIKEFGWIGSLQSLMGLPSMVKRIARINAMHTVLSNKAATSHHQPIEREGCVGTGNGLPEEDAGPFWNCIVDMESELLIVEGDSALDGIGETDWRVRGWFEKDTSSVIAKLAKEIRPSAMSWSGAGGPWVPDMSVA